MGVNSTDIFYDQSKSIPCGIKSEHALLWNGASRLNKHIIAFMYAYTYSIYV
jgi:hypothetical protein